MVNSLRGEVELVLDGKPQVMRLTLGALAELEERLGEDSLMALVERYESGRFSARDILALICAGLRGGGWQGGPSDLLGAEIGGGPVEAARAAGLLLARAFSVPASEGVGQCTAR